MVIRYASREGGARHTPHGKTGKREHDTYHTACMHTSSLTFKFKRAEFRIFSCMVRGLVVVFSFETRLGLSIWYLLLLCQPLRAVLLIQHKTRPISVVTAGLRCVVVVVVFTFYTILVSTQYLLSQLLCTTSNPTLGRFPWSQANMPKMDPRGPAGR